MAEFVQVLVVRDLPHAHIVKGLLEDAGIPAFIENEELQNAIGELAIGFSTAPRVVVAKENASRAREILQAAENAPTDAST